MNNEGQFPGQRRVFDSHKKEQTNGFTPEEFRLKIKDPYWLPNYNEIAKIVDSYTDEHGSFSLGKEEEDKWYEFLKNNKDSPVFEIWTKEYIEQFSNYLSKQAILLGGKKEKPTIILEVGAGDGRLSYFLTQQLKSSKVDTIKIITTGYDSESFKIKSKYNNVENLPEKDALEKYSPAIVICSWMIPDEDWTPDFRKTKSVKEYILIGPEGPCGTDETWEWTSGFEKIEHEDLSEVQISRLDILYGVKKAPTVDFITKTVSFIRDRKYIGM